MTDLDPTQPQPTPGGAFEPAIDAALATPVQPPATPARLGRARWPIAVGVVALVAVIVVAVALLITGRAPNARVLAYVPDGTVAYGEARLDLPGDQRMALGSFLSKFPGFADQAAIEGKLNEVMDRFVGGVTNGGQTFSTDIKPWFDGELGFSVGPLPDPATVSSGDPAAMSKARFLVLVSVKDEAGVTSWFKGLATSSGASMTDEAYNGANMILLTSKSGQVGAFAVIGGKVAVVGDVESVKAAVDTKGAGPFAGQAGPAAAMAATDADHVGFVHVALAPLLDWSSQVGQASGSASSPGIGVASGVLRDIVPAWQALALRIEGDAVVLEAASARPVRTLGPQDNRVSAVTDHVPSSALFVSVGHDVGPTLLSALDLYRTEPALKTAIDSIVQAAGFLGGSQAAVGWIGDAGVVVTHPDAGVEGGLVIVPTDRAAADRVFTSVRTLITLAGSQAGITIRDEPYAGATITTVDAGDIAALATLGGLTPGSLGGATLPAGHVEIAYAVTDQVVVVGSSPDFVKHVLDTTAATALASTDRYKALTGRVGAGVGTVFVDIAAIRGLIESAMAGADPSAVASYEQDVKPFLVPFDALIASSSVKDTVLSSKLIVTVK